MEGFKFSNSEESLKELLKSSYSQKSIPSELRKTKEFIRALVSAVCYGAVKGELTAWYSLKNVVRTRAIDLFLNQRMEETSSSVCIILTVKGVIVGSQSNSMTGIWNFWTRLQRNLIHLRDLNVSYFA